MSFSAVQTDFRRRLPRSTYHESYAHKEARTHILHEALPTELEFSKLLTLIYMNFAYVIGDLLVVVNLLERSRLVPGHSRVHHFRLSRTTLTSPKLLERFLNLKVVLYLCRLARKPSRQLAKLFNQ